MKIKKLMFHKYNMLTIKYELLSKNNSFKIVVIVTIKFSFPN